MKSLVIVAFVVVLVALSGYASGHPHGKRGKKVRKLIETACTGAADSCGDPLLKCEQQTDRDGNPKTRVDDDGNTVDAWKCKPVLCTDDPNCNCNPARGGQTEAERRCNIDSLLEQVACRVEEEGQADTTPVTCENGEVCGDQGKVVNIEGVTKTLYVCRREGQQGNGRRNSRRNGRPNGRRNQRRNNDEGGDEDGVAGDNPTDA